jgi:flagellar basal body-associated protein FliL
MQAMIAMLNSWSANFLIAAQQVDDDANEVWSGWGSVIFVISIVAIIAAVVLVLIWQISKTAQARAAATTTASQGEAYRALAEQAAAAQEKMATDLVALNVTITDLRERVASIEKMMREVE